MEKAAMQYANSINSLKNKIVETQINAIQEAAEILANTVVKDGIVYTFGTGHSHIIAEETAYRAGGLAPMDAILEPSLTGHTKVFQSEYMERLEGIAEVILNYYNPKPKDTLIIISNSGRNAVPIEMAEIAHQRGMKVIAITSLQHSQGTTSRHSSGKKLYQIADVVIDNCCPKGDCLLHLEKMQQPIGPGSGVSGLLIMHMIIVQAIQNLVELGIDPPVFMSGNIDGSDEFNQPFLDQYWGRIKIW